MVAIINFHATSSLVERRHWYNGHCQSFVHAVAETAITSMDDFIQFIPLLRLSLAGILVENV